MVCRVLVVDDEPINRMVMEQVLHLLRCDVQQARHGREALDLLRGQSFDLVLLDIHMPELSGFDVIEQLRGKGGPNQDILVAAVTADTTKNEAHYRCAGFNAYINKPVDFDCVSDLVALALPGKAAA